jgi:hypothetical protein
MVHCLRNPQQTRDTFTIPQEDSDPYQSRHAIYFAAVLLVRNPRSACEIPAQRLPIPQQTVLPRKNILLWIDDVLLGIQ